MLRKNAKIELMARVPLFAQCSKRELAEIAALADELSLPAGRKLAAEGAAGHEFVVIAEGAADVKRRGRVVNRLRAGDFLGEIALVTGQKRTATVTTTEPSRLLVLTAPAFRSLLRDHPALQLKVLDALAERLPTE
ncbi:MAG TPA: cyclic nucleotide-binding domain-containing protein [Gaiellaceae bacterium]|nr:cyclic nucleotide-binding domain-containing protein [Gaiellaceae bacterium]